MERYAMEAQARADELLDLLSEEQLDLLREWLRTSIDEELIRFMLTFSPRIGVLLGQTPAKDRAWLEQKSKQVFLREWVAARYWAIASANALSIAAALQDVPGLRYRQAVRLAAPVAEQHLDRPDIEDVLSLRFHVL